MRLCFTSVPNCSVSSGPSRTPSAQTRIRVWLRGLLGHFLSCSLVRLQIARGIVNGYFLRPLVAKYCSSSVPHFSVVPAGMRSTCCGTSFATVYAQLVLLFFFILLVTYLLQQEVYLRTAHRTPSQALRAPLDSLCLRRDGTGRPSSVHDHRGRLRSGVSTSKRREQVSNTYPLSLAHVLTGAAPSPQRAVLKIFDLGGSLHWARSLPPCLGCTSSWAAAAPRLSLCVQGARRF